MTHEDSPQRALGDTAEHALPYLRRYARALTGSQPDGDALVVATLETLISDRRGFDTCEDSRVGLFKVFHSVWEASGSTVHQHETGLKAQAQKRLSQLAPLSREALLLTTMEGFGVPEASTILDRTEKQVRVSLRHAHEQMQEAVRGRVLIIEDEGMISMELEAMVSDMGHSVTGVARTHKDARALGQTAPPDLILTDIRLADDSSGIEAVADILQIIGERPIIFITAYPERLLTGQTPEPAFLIAKPYTEEQVRSAVSQAMFFSSVAGLQ